LNPVLMQKHIEKGSQ